MTTGPPPPLAARAAEMQRLAAVLGLARAGEAQTVLLTGPAGVGKTSLWQGVAESAGLAVAVGRCLPTVSVSVPLGPVRRAIASLTPGGSATAAAVVDGPEATAPVRLDRWIDEACASAPLLLVVEDLQWADQLTLDALLYVVGGPAERRLAVVGTIRVEEVGDPHRLRGWVADVRRLPRTTELALGPLDRQGTREQLADLLGDLPSQGLLDDVFGRGGGIPLFTRMLAEGATAHDERAPAGVSAGLREAVLQSCYRLDPAVRERVSQLAVGGGPRRAEALAAVVDAPPLAVERALGAATSAGVLERSDAGAYWFRHPLYAEVLEDAVPADERSRWHAAFAQALARSAATASPEAATALAEHRYRAGDEPAAYATALSAADAQLAAGVPSAAVALLRRALGLRTRVEAEQSEVQLLVRLRAAAAAAGSARDELDAVTALLARRSPADEPLAVAELLVRRALLRLSTGQAFLSAEELGAAVTLSAVAPVSPEHALALAELAHAELWHDRPGAAERAASALAVARAAGDPRALAYALVANAMAALRRDDSAEGLAFAAEAVDAAFASGDWWACVHAILWETNAVDAPASRPVAEALRRRREQVTAAGFPHTTVALLSCAEALNWLYLGEWQLAADRLRAALAADPGPLADAGSSLRAARLAALQGRLSEAEQHLAHADDSVQGAGSQFVNLEFDAVRTEVRLLAGDAAGAFEAALAGLEDGLQRTMCEWLVPLAVRALADEVRAVRDARGDAAVALRRVDDFERRYPAVVRDMGAPTPAYERQVGALEALREAELARARSLPDEGERWVRAADRLAAAELAWEEAYACQRAAEAVFDGRGHDRAAARDLLRRGLELAGRLRAEPVVADLRALAVRARVPVGAVPAADEPAGRAAGVTRREAEILALLVAGRTYGEIARALVISEKTVSSHISNLLTKTGTANRVALAAFAQRTGLVAH